MHPLQINAIISILYTIPLVLTGVFRQDSPGTQASHYILSSIAWCHLGYLSSHYAWQRIQVLHPLLCFYKHNLERTTLGIISIILNTIYYFAIYNRYFTFTYKNPLFVTTIVTSTICTLLNGIYVSLCIAFFFMHHQNRFASIISSERAMTFNGTLKQVLEIIDTLEHRALKDFILHWQTKSDSDILSTLPEKKEQVFKVFADHVDANGNHEISYDEFVVFCHANNVFDANALWDILTHHRQTTKIIDADVIEYMLYHALFQKKQFALAIQTDILLANWIILYIALFTIPLLGIIISSIWGYQGAFEGSINLFQVYILAATFAMNRLASNIRFASYMAMVRPFNMGELLFIDNDVYKVTKLCPTFVLAIGRDTIVLRNSQMLDSVVRNYSRSNVSDSFILEMPLNTSDYIVSQVYAKMIEYASKNWKEIDQDSIRCGWTTMENQSKVLQCNWRYNFMIYDRSRFNIVKTRFMNEVIRTTIDDVSKSVILLNAAQGSAMNQEVIDHYNGFAKN